MSSYTSNPDVWFSAHPLSRSTHNWCPIAHLKWQAVGHLMWVQKCGQCSNLEVTALCVISINSRMIRLLNLEWYNRVCCSMIEPIQRYRAHSQQEQLKSAILVIINSLAPGKFQSNFRCLILQIISVIDGWGLSCELSLRWMSLDLTDDKSTLVQVMAWCCQATSDYLSQCWPRSLSPYGITGPQWVKRVQSSYQHYPTHAHG